MLPRISQINPCQALSCMLMSLDRKRKRGAPSRPEGIRASFLTERELKYLYHSYCSQLTRGERWNAWYLSQHLRLCFRNTLITSLSAYLKTNENNNNKNINKYTKKTFKLCKVMHGVTSLEPGKNIIRCHPFMWKYWLLKHLCIIFVL